MTERSYTVLLYSDDPQVRERMRLAIGARPAKDLKVRFVEASTYADGVVVASALMRKVLDGGTPEDIGAAVAELRVALDAA